MIFKFQLFLLKSKIKIKMQKHLKQQSRLWDYNINQMLGKGEYGQVFQVVNKTNQQVYALKKMPIGGAHVHSYLQIKQKQKIQAFKQIKCLKLLSHPAIIQYKQSFLSMDNIYIVMQYAGKGDFLKIVEERKRKEKYYTQDQLWNLFQSIVKGLKYLHEKSIIHRDLKLENIFLTDEGKVKIGDLGMSKIITRQDQLISTRVGTPIYFAPQMIKNQLYTFPVDIWSLGCVLYYLTTLQHPFSNASIQTLGYYVIDKGPKPIKGHYSTQLIGFVNSCLEQDSKLRPNIFQLAVKLKDKNKNPNPRDNKISIFNLRQLSKIVNSHAEAQSERKASHNQNNYKQSSSVLMDSPRKIYTSLGKHIRSDNKNFRANTDYRYIMNQNLVDCPQSPTFRRRVSGGSKPQTFKRKKLVSTDLNESCNSPLIKSSGFSFQLINNQAKKSQKKLDNEEQVSLFDLSPNKIIKFRKLSSRRSVR